MRTALLRLLALLLSVMMLLCGCIPDFQSYLNDILDENLPTAYRDMEYTRPDPAQLESALDTACTFAETAPSLEELLDAIQNFYQVYDRFYTDYRLAEIYYCSDLTNSYWHEEYNYCAESVPQWDAALDTLYRALAASPLRDVLEDEEYFGADYFDVYEGESIWDETYLSMLEQEAELINRYYTLSDEALATEYYSEEYFSTFTMPMTELLVSLIALRQQIAAYCGFSDYAEYAYASGYARDYTPQQAEPYLEQVGQTLYDVYCQANDSDVWAFGSAYCSTTDTFDYLANAADAMGGAIWEAFYVLSACGLYDIGYNANKYDSSFETYLWSYGTPFIFMNPYRDQSDKLTFSHEFGHFANDYVCGGSYAGTDIAEVHSQAFEYLSLCYTENSEELTRWKMVDSLSTFVECSAYALFEQRIYRLTGNDLTAENLLALYEEVGKEFGFDSWDWDSRDLITVTHFFTHPMYNISYVVSNDLAMQFYQLEQEESGKGLTLYEQCLYSEDSYLLYFAQEYGLESPFSPGRLASIKATFEAALQ